MLSPEEIFIYRHILEFIDESYGYTPSSYSINALEAFIENPFIYHGYSWYERHFYRNIVEPPIFKKLLEHFSKEDILKLHEYRNSINEESFQNLGIEPFVFDIYLNIIKKDSVVCTRSFSFFKILKITDNKFLKVEYGEGKYRYYNIRDVMKLN